MRYMGEDTNGSGKFYLSDDNEIFYGQSEERATKQTKMSLQKFDDFVKQNEVKIDPVFGELLPSMLGSQMPQELGQSPISADASESLGGSGAFLDSLTQPTEADKLAQARKDQLKPQAIAGGTALAFGGVEFLMDELAKGQGRLKELDEEEKKIGDPGMSEAEKREMRKRSMAPVRSQITEQRQRQEALQASQGGERSLGALMQQSEAGQRAIADASVKVDELVSQADVSEEMREQARLDRIRAERARYEEARRARRREAVSGLADTAGAFIGETVYTVGPGQLTIANLQEKGLSETQISSLTDSLLKDPDMDPAAILEVLLKSGVDNKTAMGLAPQLVKGQ